MTQYKPTGSLKDFIEAGKIKTRVLGSVERHVLSKPMDTSRRTNVLHPSDMVDDAWCHRASYFHILGHTPVKRDYSFRILSVFEEGHAIHAKWQTWFKEMGTLWGKWKCHECNEIFWGRPKDHDPKVPLHGYEYLEVTLNYPKLHIAGHSDGLLLDMGDPLMLEIKSIGAGTLRWEAGELFAENNGDFDKTWKAVTSPFMKHVNQVQIYMKLAELLDLEYKPQEAVLVYESKSNQEAKEFVVPKSDFGISHLFEAAQMIADAVANKTPPVCNIGTTGCKRCGGYTDESN